jgi:hypothetical protein
VLGRPGEKGAGHRADWSPVNWTDPLELGRDGRRNWP